MISSGAGDPTLERQTSPRTWGDFGSREPLTTTKYVRLSVQFLYGDEPSAMRSV